jgi:hypothetical protein
MLDFGPVEQNIALQAYRANEPLPDRIANAPELQEGLALYLQAFFDLDSERSSGLSLGRIGWLSIRQYALTQKFDEVQTQDLHYFISNMDVAYLERAKEKEKK